MIGMRERVAAQEEESRFSTLLPLAQLAANQTRQTRGAARLWRGPRVSRPVFFFFFFSCQPTCFDTRRDSAARFRQSAAAQGGRDFCPNAPPPPPPPKTPPNPLLSAPDAEAEACSAYKLNSGSLDERAAPFSVVIIKHTHCARAPASIVIKSNSVTLFRDLRWTHICLQQQQRRRYHELEIRLSGK